MSNLLATLMSSTNALRAFDRALNVVQNNVANASTPGYAKQVQTLTAERFDPDRGFAGGVKAGIAVSRRSQYAEQAVRKQQSGLGYAGQRQLDLEQLEPVFTPIENAGVPGALSKFFQSFSQVTVNPNSGVARQIILDRAEAVAQSFRETAVGIQSSRVSIDRQIYSTVAKVNGLLEQVRQFNIGRRTNSADGVDAGVDANLHSLLENLSELVDFQALEASDGSLTLLMGGSEPLVLGDHSFPIRADIQDPGGLTLFNQEGRDVTSTVHGGELGALRDTRNDTLPGYLAKLNTMATAFADTVNTQLAAGLDQNSNPPVGNLFSIGNPLYPALTIGVNGLAPGELALASAAAPGGAGNALDIARLAGSKTVGEFTFTEYFGNIGASVGQDLNEARDAYGTHEALLSQALTIREQTQSVSLDEEAAILLNFQKGYEASTRIITILNELTDTVMGILR